VERLVRRGDDDGVRAGADALGRRGVPAPVDGGLVAEQREEGEEVRLLGAAGEQDLVGGPVVAVADGRPELGVAVRRDDVAELPRVEARRATGCRSRPA